MSDFKPTLYLNHRCPFCLKLMIFVREAGMWDDFALEVFEPGSDAHAAIKEKLASHFDSVTFPSAQIAPGEYMKDTAALIARFEEQSGKSAADMPLLDYYQTGVMKQVGELFMENKRLKEGVPA